MASWCCGTDAELSATQAFADVFPQSAGFFEHSYSVEHDDVARRFLSRVWKLEGSKLFSDVLTSDFDKVDKIDILWAGWPCQDASTLAHQNANEEHRQCVSNGQLRTGSVFKRLVDYLTRKPVPMALLENVPGLSHPSKDTGLSNLDHCMSLLKSAGYFVMVWRLNSQNYGCAQNRPRLWFTLFSMKLLLGTCLRSGRRSMEEALRMVQHQMTSRMRRFANFVASTSLDHVLLPECHEYMQK